MSETSRRTSVEEIKKKFEVDIKPKSEKSQIKRSPAFRCDRPNLLKSQSHNEIHEESEKSQKPNHSDSENSLDYTVKLISRRKNILEQEDLYAKPKKDLHLTESLRIALKAPLPQGPPPKKPPRLFLHKAANGSNILEKLEKIENFVKNQRVIAPRIGDDEERRILENKENSFVANGEFGCEKRFEDLTIKTAIEPIYDLPLNKSPNYPTTFETFGKAGFKQVSSFRHLKPEAELPLHYLCTDITQQPASAQNTDLNTFQRENKLRQTLSDGSPKKPPVFRKFSLDEECLKPVSDVKIIMNQAFGSPATQNLIDSDSDSSDSAINLDGLR